MNYVAKAATAEQAEAKIKAGASAIEIQMLPNQADYTIEELADYADSFKDYKVVSVHPMMDTNRGLFGSAAIDELADNANIFYTDFDPETSCVRDNVIWEELMRSSIGAAACVAERLGILQDEYVYVILHYTGRCTDFFPESITAQRMSLLVQTMLKHFHYVKFALENITFFDVHSTATAFHINNVDLYFMTELLMFLRTECEDYDDLSKALETKKSRIGLCFDTCHAEMYLGVLKALKPYLQSSTFPTEYCDATLSELAHVWAPYTSIVHFSRLEGAGYGPRQHGLPFGNVLECQHVYDAISSIVHNEPIFVLEVSEADHLDPEGIKSTISCLEKITRPDPYKGLSIMDAFEH